MRRASWVVTILFCAVMSGTTNAQPRAMMRRIVVRPQGPGNVNLPFTDTDSAGNQWMIYNAGALQQAGNQPVFSQGGVLAVNGTGIGGAGGAALDAKTGELVFDQIPMGSFMVTRRILINKQDSYVRYIDIIKNTTAQAQQASIQLRTNTNYGISSAEVITDPRKKDHQIGWSGMTGINRAAVDVYAGIGAKTVPTVQYQPGTNMVMADFQVSVPAGKEVAIMHLHTALPTQQDGVKFVLGLKGEKLLKDVSPEIRRAIVNFRGGFNYIGDYEILRGDVFDVVELRTGDQVKGTLKDDAYKLTTFYGTVTVPVDRVIGMINIGQFRPRQLVVTMDGEVFGGNLDRDSVTLEMSSGQVIKIPVAQISRLGYRKRPNEPEEPAMNKPMVLMRSGDRVMIQMPTDKIEITTRYGLLKLDPASVASIAFQSEENGVHEIYLTDGSKFAGLVSADQFSMKLAGAGPDQVVKFPSSEILRLQLTAKVNEPDDTTPTLALVNEDQMVGVLTGQLKLDTAFDTLDLDAAQIKHLSHSKDVGTDVQVTLWDNTTVSGQLEQQEVACHLVSGADVQIPVALVDEYNQPLPQPSAAMVEKIKAAVANLSADDWKQRDEAEATLVGMGPPVAGVLKQLRSSQSPEAQGRIDAVLKQLEQDAGKNPTPAAAPAGGAAAWPIPVQPNAPMIPMPLD